MSKYPLMKHVKKVSYIKAIRDKCLDCTLNNYNEIKYCTITDCPLFPYRFGCSPSTFIKRNAGKVKIVE